jgi:hypothetical protein
MSLSPNAQAKKMRVYRAPSSPIAYFFWRIKMWFEATFALSMLERWEKVLLCTYTLLSSSSSFPSSALKFDLQSLCSPSTVMFSLPLSLFTRHID